MNCLFKKGFVCPKYFICVKYDLSLPNMYKKLLSNTFSQSKDISSSSKIILKKNDIHLTFIKQKKKHELTWKTVENTPEYFIYAYEDM